MYRFLIAAAFILFPLARPAFCQAPDQADPDLRKPRRMAISAEVGANSLATLVGPIFSYYVNPQVILDMGVGLSTVGYRPGIRARYNFSRAKLTPFVSGAFKYGMGTSATNITVKNGTSQEEFRVKAKPSPFLDLAFGLDYLAHNGFLCMGTLGYSKLLGSRNYEVLDGFTPNEKSTDVLDLMFGSGLAISVSLGKAF